MSKKVSSVDPISLLREYITSNKPIKHSEDNLYFGTSKLPLNTPTAWNPKITGKQYSLGDLWLFLDSHLNPDKYSGNKYYEDMRKYNLQIVSTHDKEEIINYFTGKIEDSEAINQELKASIKVNKDKKKSTKPKYDEEPSVKKKLKTENGGKETKEVKESAEGREGEQDQNEEVKQSDVYSKEKENIRIMDLLFRYEKPIDSKNRALRKMNKSFKSVLAFFSAEARPPPEETRMEAPKKQNLTRLDEVLNLGGGLGQSYPIILVLSAPAAGALSLENAREFLEQGDYKDPIKDKKEVGDKKTQRIQKDIGGRKITFEIRADVSDIKKDSLWPRVVAIFVTGYTHQFQGWPDGDRVSILFSKKRAYHMKYHDVPLHDNIKKWNVKLLEIHRTKRFLDVTTKNHFWEDLEKFLLQPPPK